MAGFKKPSSYFFSVILHGVLGYFIINSALRVAIPEGEVIEVDYNDVGISQGQQTKVVTAQEPKPDAPAEAPAPAPKSAEVDANEIVVAKKNPPKVLPVKEPVKPEKSFKDLPKPVSKLSDVAPMTDDEEAPEVAKAEPTIQPAIEPPPAPSPEEVQEEESEPVAVAPAPMPVEIEDPEPAPPQAAPQTNAPPAPVAQAHSNANPVQGGSVGETTGSQPNTSLAKYGIPDGTPIKDGRLLRGRPGNRKPAYPYTARARRQTGTVSLLIYVNQQGAVEKAFVEKSSGHAVLDKAAVDAYTRWKYYPGQAGMIRQVANFVLND